MELSSFEAEKQSATHTSTRTIATQLTNFRTTLKDYKKGLCKLSSLNPVIPAATQTTVFFSNPLSYALHSNEHCDL